MTDPLQQFLETFPHCKALGMHFITSGSGTADMSLPYQEALIGDAQTGVIHGGALFALIDTCSAAAAITHPDIHGPVSTLTLRIDYMRPAHVGETLTTKAICYQKTRSAAFVRSTTYDHDLDRPVATSTGIFTTL